MTKVALALVSFILGACCTALALAVSQAATRPQAPQLPTLIAGGQEPVVPPLSWSMSDVSINFPGIQPLDGLDCDKCVLNVARLSYGGGAVRLNNTEIPKGIPIELKGAALNTVNLLMVLGVFSNSQQSAPTPLPKTPPRHKKDELEIKPQSNFSIVSLEGLQK